MENAIQATGLCKRYGDFALQNVDITVPAGCITGFIGENGAGKTTTIKALLGLIRPDAGTVQVLGMDPFTQRRQLNRELGAVLDGAFFFEGMRAQDIGSVMARLHPLWEQPLFEQYCARFSLPLKKPVKEYSKGMRAKLALVTALAHRPKLLVMDEPTSGLDPVVRSEILDLFLEFIEDEQHSIFLSSHITSDLEKVADYITFLHGGRVVLHGEKDALLETYGVAKCARADAGALESGPWQIVGRRESKFDTELLVAGKNALRAAHPEVLVEPASLDDIMTFFAKEH